MPRLGHATPPRLVDLGAHRIALGNYQLPRSDPQPWMHQGGASKGRPTLKDTIGPYKELHQLHTPLQVAPLLHGAINRGARLTLDTHFKKKLSTLSRCSISVGH
jgi:hypothetical protein